MLVAQQKFRSCMIGHYNRSCHVIMCNMHEMWGLIYSHAMRTVPMSYHVLPHMQQHHAHIAQHMHAGKPATLCIRAMPEITYGHVVHTTPVIFIKLTASHFSTLNTKIANQNMLKRILIAMHNENKVNCNENFRICAEEPVVPLYKW